MRDDELGGALHAAPCRRRRRSQWADGAPRGWKPHGRAPSGRGTPLESTAVVRAPTRLPPREASRANAPDGGPDDVALLAAGGAEGRGSPSRRPRATARARGRRWCRGRRAAWCGPSPPSRCGGCRRPRHRAAPHRSRCPARAAVRRSRPAAGRRAGAGRPARGSRSRQPTVGSPAASQATQRDASAHRAEGWTRGAPTFVRVATSTSSTVTPSATASKERTRRWFNTSYATS